MTSTRLVDLNGADNLVIRKDFENCQFMDADFKAGLLSACDSLNYVHLEVDVEAMVKLLDEWILVNIGEENVAEAKTKHLIKNMKEWARLVRK